jgi:hypothetical protein
MNIDLITKNKLLNSKNCWFEVFGHLSFLCILFLSVWFYLERTLFGDCPSYIFSMITDHEWQFSFHRYTNIFLQAIPRLFIELGLPLKAVLISFSFSYVAFYYFLFLMCLYVIKNKVAAFAIIVSVFGTQGHMFYQTISEVQMAIALSVILWAWLEYRSSVKREWLWVLVACILALLNYFSHPVWVFTVFFILGYFLISNNLWKDKWFYIILLFNIGLVLLKFITVNGYEAGQLKELHNYREHIAHLTQLFSFHYYFGYWKLYFMNSVLFIMVSLFLVFKKKWLLFSYYFFAVCGFLLVHILAYALGESLEMMEKSFLPLTLLISLPFIDKMVFTSSKISIIGSLVLILWLIYIPFQLNYAARDFTHRLKYIDELVEECKGYNEDHFIINADTPDKERMRATWAYSIETLMYTTIKYPERPMTFYVDDNPPGMEERLKNPNTFLYLGWYHYLDARKFNPKYFRWNYKGYRRIK